MQLDRLKEQRLLWVGAALVAVGAIVFIIGYANVRTESDTALQMPYVFSAGFFGALVTGLGFVAIRSNDDRNLQTRLHEIEDAVAELRQSHGYLTRMLEAALLPDEEVLTLEEEARVR